VKELSVVMKGEENELRGGLRGVFRKNDLKSRKSRV
jgi:hypothetical protein